MTTRYLGAPIARNEDRRLLTGRALFVDNVERPGMLHVAFLRSPHAHARLGAVDLSRVRERPGVVAAYAADDLGDYWVRGAFLLQRGRYGVTRVTPRDALRWATTGSAACLGRPELGTITPGAAADLVLFTLDELRFAGALDPLAALVLSGAHRADRVMVAGRWVVEEGTIPNLDLAALIRRQNAAAAILHR